MTDVPWLFDASYNEEKVVVKFVRDRYGDEGHRFLADKNLAPKYLRCEHLVGGWYVVVMEKVEGRLLNALDLSIKEALNCAVQEMHMNHTIH